MATDQATAQLTTGHAAEFNELQSALIYPGLASQRGRPGSGQGAGQSAHPPRAGRQQVDNYRTVRREMEARMTRKTVAATALAHEAAGSYWLDLAVLDASHLRRPAKEFRAALVLTIVVIL